MAQEVIELVRLERKYEAAATFAAFCHVACPKDKPKVWDEQLLSLYHWLINNNGMEEAAQLLWSPKLFDFRPASTKAVWDLFDRANTGLIMGAASMSKSYTMAVRLFLEWTRDPASTTVRVIGPSSEHLQDNLFSHLVRLHEGASLPMPGEVGDLFIGLSRRNRISSIKGLVIPIGQNKKSGRLQGMKCFPRKTPHPKFGPMSRMFVFLDEIENVPEGIWSDIDNILSNVSADVRRGIKIFGAFNPVNANAEVAKRAEPPFGWKDLDPDKHYAWTSVRGWDVIRLDALKCENVIEGKVIFEGLQTRAGVEKIAKNAGGTESPGYLAMVRATYPLKGSVLSVFSPGIVHKLRGEFIWYSDPAPVGSVDLALEGTSNAVFSYGLFGSATGVIFPPSLEHPTGRKELFKVPGNVVVPRYGLQLQQQFVLPKGDTVAMYESIVKMCRQLRIKPEHVCVDRTGNGAGVHDLLRNQWSLAVQGVNYSESATERKIMAEDLKTPKEEYKRIVTELWFAMRKWSEFGYLLVAPLVDVSKLFEQMTKRTYRTDGDKTKVESKADYISRGNLSPDEADSMSLMVHGVRCSFSIVLSMTGDAEFSPSDDDSFSTDTYRVDITNRNDVLDAY